MFIYVVFVACQPTRLVCFPERQDLKHEVEGVFFFLFAHFVILLVFFRGIASALEVRNAFRFRYSNPKTMVQGPSFLLTRRGVSFPCLVVAASSAASTLR